MHEFTETQWEKFRQVSLLLKVIDEIVQEAEPGYGGRRTHVSVGNLKLFLIDDGYSIEIGCHRLPPVAQGTYDTNPYSGDGDNPIRLKDLAVKMNMNRAALKKYVLELGIMPKPDMYRESKSKYNPTMFVTQGEAERIFQSGVSYGIQDDDVPF